MNPSTATPGRQSVSTISALDRRWCRHFTALAIGPLKVPSVDDLRRLFIDLMHEQPGLPLVSTIGGNGTTWLAVPPQDRATHAERMVTSGGDLTYDDVAGYIERYRPPLDSSLPISIVVGPESLVVYSTHLLGDGNTLSRMALMIAQADAAGLVELRNRATFRDALSVLRSEATEHWRDWGRRAFRRGRADTRTTNAVPPDSIGTPARSVPIPVAADSRGADAVLTNTQLSAITRWRNRNCPGVSITAVLASVIYRSLVEQGIPVDGTGLNTLFDLRRYLPPDRQAIYGNLSQSVFIRTDLPDPVAVASDLDEVIASARLVPGLVIGAVMARVRPPRAGHTQDLGPITMSLSVMPGLPGLTGLPWLNEAGRRYVGYAYPAGLRGISIFAVRLRDRMELIASFDGRAINPAAVRSALNNVGDADRLLALPR